MEIKKRGYTFKNVYRYNNKITHHTFEVIIDLMDIKHKKSNENIYNTYYLIESCGYYKLQDVFGDFTNYMISKKEVEDKIFLETVGD